MAAMAPQGHRHGQMAEAVGTGVVLMLAAGSMMLARHEARGQAVTMSPAARMTN